MGGYMDIKKLNSLLNREEGAKLDFKLRMEINGESGKRELIKDISAIANSRGGRGYIVIGIEDKTKSIIGIDGKCNFKEEQIQQIVTSRCEPPIPVTVDFIKLQNKTIGVITIYDGGQKPYQVRDNGAFYIRRGSTTDIMRKVELIQAFEENFNFSIETTPLIRTDIRQLNNKLVNKYFNKKGIVVTEENRTYLLQSSSIIYKEQENSKERCTFGGLLVFADNNAIQLPNNMIRIVNQINKVEVSVKIIQGNLLCMIDSAEAFIAKVLPNQYPVEAINEAIRNAVLYRDYSDMNRVIEVILGTRKIEVISPGCSLNAYESRNGQINTRKNIWLYEKLITLDEGQRFLKQGAGIKRMKYALKGIGKIKFINSYIENKFKVIFPGINNI